MGTRSNIRVEPCNVSWKGTDVGFTEGDLEIEIEDQDVDINAHQEGTDLLDAIRTGKSISLGLTLKETSLAQLKTMLEASGATLAAAVAEVVSITCPAATSINSKYFTFEIANSGTKYYAWFNVNSGGVDPAVSGRTGVAVAVATGATAAQVATALSAAIDALAGFTASASGAVVTMTQVTAGGAPDPADVDSGVTIEVTTQGCNAITGWGDSKSFTSKYSAAGQLILHPKALSSSDKTRDWNVWKAYPNLEGLVLSGENPMTVSLTFKCFKDTARPSGVNLFAIGDGA